MDPTKIMMEMISFRYFELKTKQERILYSSSLGDSRKTSSLISLNRNSQLAVLHSRFLQLFTISQFACLDTIHAPFDSSLARNVLNFKTFHIIARKQPPEHLYRPIAAYFYLIRINYRINVILIVNS